jgi:hypothetical protein
MPLTNSTTIRPEVLPGWHAHPQNGLVPYARTVKTEVTITPASSQR